MRNYGLKREDKSFIKITQRVDVGSLRYQICDQLRMVKHSRAVQRRHLLNVCAKETNSLLEWLQVKHELHNLKSALSTAKK